MPEKFERIAKVATLYIHVYTTFEYMYCTREKLFSAISVRFHHFRRQFCLDERMRRRIEIYMRAYARNINFSRNIMRQNSYTKFTPTGNFHKTLGSISLEGLKNLCLEVKLRGVWIVCNISAAAAACIKLHLSIFTVLYGVEKLTED